MNAGSIWRTLGLDGVADEREIRRAYASKLRDTNPEDDPEGFQALRAAYEHALAWSRSDWARDENEEGSETTGDQTALADEAQVHLGAEPRMSAGEPSPWGPSLDQLKRNLIEVAHSTTVSSADAELAFTAFAEDIRHIDLVREAEQELWAARLIASALPASDTLVRIAADRFGWTRDAAMRDGAIEAVLQRCRELDLIDALKQPGDPHHEAWTQLTRPPSNRFKMRLSALKPDLPARIFNLRHAAWTEYHGLTWSFHNEAVLWWDHYFEKPRLRWTTLLAAGFWLMLVWTLSDAAKQSQDKLPGIIWMIALAATPFNPMIYLLARRFNPSFRYPIPKWHRPATIGWMSACALLPIGACGIATYPGGLLVVAAALAAALTMVATTPDAPLVGFMERNNAVSGSIWRFGAISLLLGQLVPPAFSPPTVAIVGLLAMAVTRGRAAILEFYSVAIPRWPGPIGYAIAAGLLATALKLTGPLPREVNPDLVFIALLAFAIAAIAEASDNGRPTWILSRLSWIVLLVLFITVTPPPERSASGQPSPVPLAENSLPASEAIDQLLRLEYGQHLDGDRLRLANPELYNLLETNWDIAVEGRTTDTYGAAMKRLLSEWVAAALPAADWTQTKELWRLRLAAEKAALAKADYKKCRRLMAGGLELTLLPDGIHDSQRRLFASLVLVGKKPSGPREAGASKRTMIPGDIIVAAKNTAGLTEDRMEAALADKGGDRDRCAMHAGLIDALLAAPRKQAEPILRQL